jgi:hypothetical protein
MIAALLALICVLPVAAPFIPEGPPVGDVHRAALEYASIEARDPVYWKKRAKMAALLPKLQFDFGHNLRSDVQVDINDNVYVGSSGIVIGPEEGKYSESLNANRNIGVRAVWSLNELIFNRDLLNISRESLVIMRERNSLLDSVNKHYFERKKLIAEIGELEERQKKGKPPPKLKNELFIRKIALDKSTAALDALTGGWYSQQLGTK